MVRWDFLLIIAFHILYSVIIATEVTFYPRFIFSVLCFVVDATTLKAVKIPIYFIIDTEISYALRFYYYILCRGLNYKPFIIPFLYYCAFYTPFSRISGIRWAFPILTFLTTAKSYQ
jgi:hypothetical protein